ncbi:MAG: CDP-alcohol phosphatidyltransferase family protein [Balneolia bacterium]|nr:CDP-alcohol phosphatidyltransferase family protein [Balneolia bacterium]
METADKIDTPGVKPLNQVWTVGNFLSVSRILALPILIWLHQANNFQPNLEMKLIIVYMVLSDFLDGFASRALNQVSEMGKWLDPVADKVCAAVLFTYVWYIDLMPSWLFAIILLRDVFILVGSLIIKKKRGKVAMSVMAGKIAVNVLALYWLVLVFLPEMTQLILILKYSSVFMLVLSSYIYLRRMIDILNGASYK